VAFVAALLAGPGGAQDAERPIVVASKPFAESVILGEMFTQLLAQRGFRVEHRSGMGQTAVLHEALDVGGIDCYPEYTGTGYMAVLKRPTSSDARAVYRTVADEYAARWGMRWLPSLGFQNTYAMAVRPEVAERHGLRTLSDLARVGPQLTAALSTSFQEREDGLPGLQRVYGLTLKSARAMDQALKYRAIGAGAVDLIDGYSTDGEIATYGLVVLEDDRRFFPPYDCCPLVGRRLMDERPGAVAVLHLLAGRIDEVRMRRWNAAVSVQQADPAAVAAAALAELGFGAHAAPDRPSLVARVLHLTAQHLGMVLLALTIGCLVAMPLGVWLERRRGAAEHVVRAIGVLQTIPSLALLAFMIAIWKDIGAGPAVSALFLYSLFPIVRATYTGVRDADPAAVAAATALGMTPGQVLRHVRLPLAAPFVMAGVRTAAVITVGTATLAAFVGAGGLGEPIMEGLALLNNELILLGALPAAGLALLVDAGLAVIERAVRPRGV
jgi:osmoprotectant transport system permease protein